MSCGPSVFGARVRPHRFSACVRPVEFSGPAIDLDFTSGLYWAEGQGQATYGALPQEVTARTGAGWAQALSGAFSEFATDLPRVTNRGLLIEESRTNQIATSAGTGAVVGSPGTLPTGWILTLPTGLSREIVALGTDSATGLARVRLKISGTTTAVGQIALSFGAVTSVAATVGQVWTASVRLGLAAGTLPPNLNIRQRIADGANAGLSFAGAAIPSLTATPQLVSYTATMPASTAYTMTQVGQSGNMASGTVVDVTLDIVAPMLSLGAMALSPIITTGAVATRGAERSRLDLTQAWGAAPMTWLATGEIEAVEDTSNRVLAAVTDGTLDDGLWFGRAATGEAYAQIYVGGALVGNLAVAGKTGARTIRLAVSWDGTTWRGACDGASLGSVAAAAPTGLDTLDLGTVTGLAPWNGYVRQARAWRRALPLADLITLTT